MPSAGASRPSNHNLQRGFLNSRAASPRLTSMQWPQPAVPVGSGLKVLGTCNPQPPLIVLISDIVLFSNTAQYKPTGIGVVHFVLLHTYAGVSAPDSPSRRRDEL